MGSPLVPAVVAVGLVRAGESEAPGPHVYRPLCDTGASPSRILKPTPRLFAMRVPLAPMQIHPRQSSSVQFRRPAASVDLAHAARCITRHVKTSIATANYHAAGEQHCAWS
ncbi:hypothetical protein LZ31DRAFT_550911 [Colletotrichum somersetense]|nr:hypothetical protein LZ31DRAFT_550911 [Colletotrichum somersetense]